jgi:hypothetical protein
LNSTPARAAATRPDPTPPTTNAVRHDVRVRPSPPTELAGAAEAARCELPGAADADERLADLSDVGGGLTAAARADADVDGVVSHPGLPGGRSRLTMRLLSFTMRVRATSPERLGGFDAEVARRVEAVEVQPGGVA